MSLILSQPVDWENWQMYCQVCGKAVGIERLEVILDMAKQGTEVKCFNCEPLGVDWYPDGVVLQESTYLLGIGDRAFLCHWIDDPLTTTPKELHASRISHACYYDLKTGRVSYITKKRSTGLVVLLGGK